MNGRFHYYEGYPMETVTFYVRVMGRLGVKVLFLTNASGGINLDLKVPELVAITDHISFNAEPVLRGPNMGSFLESPWHEALQGPGHRRYHSSPGQNRRDEDR